MSSKDLIRNELRALRKEGAALLDLLAGRQKGLTEFRSKYQNWYTKALKLVATLAPDRIDEFRAYYEIDPKRKSLTAHTYMIQDFIKSTPAAADILTRRPLWDAHRTVHIRLISQLEIVNSLHSRVDGVVANLQATVAADLEDASLATAETLGKINLRAAGALAGVVVEDHLQRVLTDRGLQLSKSRATIADMNELLKQAGVVEIASWRKIKYLADLRNLCVHKRDREPTPDEVNELISGANWL